MLTNGGGFIIITRGLKLAKLTERTRCNGTWTEAQFRSFIKNQLRHATLKWAPIQVCMKEATTRRGWKMCACCQQEVQVSIIDQATGKRVKNIFCDHIDPIVPVSGWESWDSCIDKMFCELDNLQALCGKCHKEKSLEETQQRAEIRRSK